MVMTRPSSHLKSSHWMESHVGQVSGVRLGKDTKVTAMSRLGFGSHLRRRGTTHRNDRYAGVAVGSARTCWVSGR